MNVFYLIENIIFADARGCSACNGEGRLTALGLSMLIVYTLNNVVFWKERPNVFAPLSQMMKRLIILIVAIYVTCSICIVV